MTANRRSRDSNKYLQKKEMKSERGLQDYKQNPTEPKTEKLNDTESPSFYRESKTGAQ